MSLGKRHIAIFGIKYFPSRGGTSRVVESLLRQLKDEYIITIYCYAHPKATTNIPGVRTVSFPEPTIKNFGVFFYFLKCLMHLLFKGNYDMVHVHKTEAAYFVPFIRLRYPVVITSHEIPYKNNKWSWFGKIYFHVAEWIFMYSGARRTSISKTQCEYYEEKYHKQVCYIPNGIEKIQLAEDDVLDKFMKDHSIDNRFLFFAARRIIPIKGCHHFLKALNNLNYQGQVVIAGDTEQMKNYTQDLKKMTRNLNVTFIGYIDSLSLLNSLIKKAELFIFPSEIEGMSMMLLEVALMGTPIICSDIPQNKVILSDDHVLFFKSKDDVDLSEKLQHALLQREDLLKKAEKASQFVKSNYSIESIASKYIDLYNKQLSPKATHEYS